MEDLEKIEMFVVDRKWMAHKSWRIYLRLPKDQPLLPVRLTCLIEEKVQIEISHPDVTINIDPAFIVNVPSKGKNFLLVIETCYEQQGPKVGPHVTGLYQKDVMVSIRPLGQVVEPPKPEPKPEVTPERKKALMGLHILFDNPKFQQFVAYITSTDITDKTICKTAFKWHEQIKSCSELTDERIAEWRHDFTEWVNGRRP